MTSSNGSIFRVTGHLCGEFTGPRWSPRWIPRTKASDAELWCFLWSACVWINGWVNNREAGDLRRYHAHYDVIVMFVYFYLRRISRTSASILNWCIIICPTKTRCYPSVALVAVGVRESRIHLRWDTVEHYVGICEGWNFHSRLCEVLYSFPCLWSPPPGLGATNAILG